MDFDTAFHHLLGHEGSYSNHPDDPGGETGTVGGNTITVMLTGFTPALSGALDRIELVALGGAVFNLGSVNIMYS